MNLARGYRANCYKKMKQIKGCHQDSVLVIKLPDSRILGLISKSLFLGLIILALPSIGSFVRDVSVEQSVSTDNFLPMVFEDLVVEGVLKDGQKGLVLSSGVGDLFNNLWFLQYKGIDVVMDMDLDRQLVIPNEVFDFVFASSLENVKFINRVVKVDGIVVMPLGNYCDRTNEFLKRSNYKSVYIHQFDSVMVMAMRKIDAEGEEGVFDG
ncbi:uncharacterized protein [Rutidosis leptorrhynchoides]|uniref:uncharacterized protein n=1 Tax=Rutidosis leptorrhynchoides TaxID=125765 RepID=UPI003A99689A